MARDLPAWLSVPTAAALLLWPAAWNGYPIVFADTGTYLSQAINHYAGWDRPVFYSLFMLPLHAGITVWPVVVAQALLTAWLLRAVCLRLVPNISGWAFIAGTAGLALFTCLPWLVSELMPDLFTPLLILLLGLLWAAPRPPIALVPLAAFMIATQQSSLPLAAVLAVCLTALRHRAGRCGRDVPDLGGRAAPDLGGRDVPDPDGRAAPDPKRRVRLAVALPPLLAALALSVTNRATLGHFALSPYGNVFLLARVIEDGPGTDALRRACPGAQWRLCRYVDRLPMNSDDFLWTSDSPLNLAGGPKAVSADAGAIIQAAVLAEPWTQAKAAMRNTLRQLVRFDSGDGLDPWPAQVTPWLRRDFPAREQARYAAASQQAGTLSVPPLLGAAHKAVALAGVAGCLLLVPAAIRRRTAAAGFLVAVLLALPVSAAITGALSGPHDRYQSRIMWLPPFVAAVSFANLRRRPA